MQYEILTKEEFTLALKGFKSEIISEIKNIVSDQGGKEWISGVEAMELIGCKSTKLSELAGSKMIIKRGSGKGSMYSRKSIVAWLNRK